MARKTGQNFTVTQGETLQIQFTITDASNVAKSLASGTGTWILKDSASGTTTYLSKTVTAGEITIGGVDNNVLTVAVTAADTVSTVLAAGTYYQRLTVADAASQTKVVADGTVTVVT